MIQMVLFYSFYGRVILHCMHVTTSLSIRVHRHLGFFQILAVVNSAAMNIGVHVSFSIMVSSGYSPVLGLLGRMVVLFLVCLFVFVFSGISILSSIVALSVYFPTNTVGGLLSPHTLSGTYYS